MHYVDELQPNPSSTIRISSPLFSGFEAPGEVSSSCNNGSIHVYAGYTLTVASQASGVTTFSHGFTQTRRAKSNDASERKRSFEIYELRPSRYTMVYTSMKSQFVFRYHKKFINKLLLMTYESYDWS